MMIKLKQIAFLIKKENIKLYFFGNNRNSFIYSQALTYVVKVENNSEKILSFPENVSGSEKINIIEPFYDKLKSGEEIKFKMISDLEKIAINNGDTKEYLEKNEIDFSKKKLL